MKNHVQIWSFVKDLYLKITLNRYTTIFFLWSFFHCFAVGISEGFTFSTDLNASTVVRTILGVARAGETPVFALLQKDGRLQFCTATPIQKHVSPCYDIWNPTNMTIGTADIRCPGMTVDMPEIDGPADGMTVQMGENNATVSFIQPSVSQCEVTISKTCTDTLVYPDQVFKNLVREDISLVVSQFWVFAISVYGIFYGSIPHIIAAFCTRLLFAAWSSYMLWRTGSYISRLERLTRDGACGFDFFDSWAAERRQTEIPVFVLGLFGLFVSAFLTWKLCRLYNHQTFNRVGAPRALFSLYRLFLALFVCLQLSCFFLVTAMGLWIDQLSNGAISVFSSWTRVYQALYICTSLFLLPWVAMGWHSIRHERRKTAVGFVVVAFVFIACWAIMFYSQVYRWTFIQWPFFGCMTSASFIVLVLSFGLGIVCRFNFGKGLSQFFHVEKVLQRANFVPEVFVLDPERGEKPPPSEKPPPRKLSSKNGKSRSSSNGSVSSIPVLAKFQPSSSSRNDQTFVIVSPPNRKNSDGGGSGGGDEIKEPELYTLKE